jgi:Mur ligase middle domain
VVGVTGSAGKTTTSWLVRSIFEELGQLTGMLGKHRWCRSIQWTPGVSTRDPMLAACRLCSA